MLLSTGNLVRELNVLSSQRLQIKVNYNRSLIYVTETLAALCTELLRRQTTKLGKNELFLSLPHSEHRIMARETIHIKFSWSVLLSFNNVTQHTASMMEKGTGNSLNHVSSYSDALVPAKLGAVYSILTTQHQHCRDADGEVVLTMGMVSGDSPPWKYDCWQVEYVSCPVVNLGLNGWITFWEDVNRVKATATVFWLRHSKLKSGVLLSVLS